MSVHKKDSEPVLVATTVASQFHIEWAGRDGTWHWGETAPSEESARVTLAARRRGHPSFAWRMVVVRTTTEAVAVA